MKVLIKDSLVISFITVVTFILLISIAQTASRYQTPIRHSVNYFVGN